jgi:hypothetical protein
MSPPGQFLRAKHISYAMAPIQVVEYAPGDKLSVYPDNIVSQCNKHRAELATFSLIPTKEYSKQFHHGKHLAILDGVLDVYYQPVTGAKIHSVLQCLGGRRLMASWHSLILAAEPPRAPRVFFDVSVSTITMLVPNCNLLVPNCNMLVSISIMFLSRLYRLLTSLVSIVDVFNVELQRDAIMLIFCCYRFATCYCIYEFHRRSTADTSLVLCYS